MPVTLGILAMGKEALRHNKVEIVLGASHGDIEQSPFLFQFRRGTDTEIGRHAAIDNIEHINGFPLLALGRVDSERIQ